ncbi:hypothetical protein IQ255_16570 [Pleurocapsales cyanobacterium LEGE 10410]|nr:hypothetical protein [Pleurocapsales cyanobacterium LEGE 10410]
MKNIQSKLVVLETPEHLKIVIPSPRFTNYLTTVFLLFNGIILLFVAVGVAAAYYANFIFKIAMAIVFVSWFRHSKYTVDFIKEMFFNTTQIEVDSKQLNVTRSLKRESNNYLLIPEEEITALRLSKSHTDSQDIFPTLFFVTKEHEYCLHRFTGFNFSNEEITLLTNKISEYLKKDIIV